MSWQLLVCSGSIATNSRIHATSLKHEDHNINNICTEMGTCRNALVSVHS